MKICAKVFDRIHFVEESLACLNIASLTEDKAIEKQPHQIIAGSINVAPNQPESVKAANARQYKLA
jgi:hypothetical protein